MGAAVLVVDRDEVRRNSICEALSASGYDTVHGSGHSVTVKDAQLAAVILAMPDSPAATQDLCQHYSKKGVPVVVVALSSSLADAEFLFQAGASACLSLPLKVKRLVHSVKRLVEENGKSEYRLPESLKAVFTEALEEGAPLGDMAEIYAGISPRNTHFRRAAPPTAAWRPVLTEDLITPFHVGTPREYLRFDRQGLIREPSSQEYNHAEKVVVARTAPPIAAAVDRLGLPVEAGAYSIVPARGLLSGYLACLLNSRLMDFYLNRIRPLDTAPSGTFLRVVDLQAIPVRLPELEVQKSLSTFGSTLSQISGHATTHTNRLLRMRVQREINQLIFEIYGMGKDEIRLLQGMHF